MADRSPRTVDEQAIGDPANLRYRPIDQAFLDRDARASMLARSGNMAALNDYLHTLGLRLPSGNEGSYFNVRTGQIERTTPPWYRDPALIGALALPAATVAVPGLLGAGATAGTPAASAGIPGAVGTSGSAAPALAGTAPAVLPTSAIGATTVGTAGYVPMAASAAPVAAGGPAVAGSEGWMPWDWAAGSGGGGGGSSLLGKIGSAFSSPNVIGAGIGAAGNLIGAGIAAGGATDAAKIQAAYLEKALEYEKQRDAYLQGLERQRYANVQQRLTPYLALGNSAADRIARLMGGSAVLPQLPTGSDQPPPPVPLQDYYQRGPATPGSPPLGTAVPRR